MRLLRHQLHNLLSLTSPLCDGITRYMISRVFRRGPSHLRQYISQSRPVSLQSRVQFITRPPIQAHHRTTHRSYQLRGPVHRIPLQASYSSAIAYILIACGSAFIVQQYFLAGSEAEATDADDETLGSSSLPSQSPYYTDMPIQQGHLGNLTPEQEIKLRELWAATLKTFGVEDPTHATAAAAYPLPDTSNDSDSIASGKEKKKKSRLSMFGKKHDEHSSGTTSPTKDHSKPSGDDEDKYGQVKEFQQIVSTQSPESLRATFWSMVKADHPDALLLRFLRARKWDVDRALVMMISTMSWRSREMHVDDDVVKNGEGGAQEDSLSSDKAVSQEGKDFLEQLRLGKSFLHGTDNEGRPLCFVRVRLHHGGDQSERSMERYTVYVIETARLALRTPVETAVSHTPLDASRYADIHSASSSTCHTSRWPIWTMLRLNS
jgi:hypothetical protein